MQGAQILENEAYSLYAAVTTDAAQHSGWRPFATPSLFVIKDFLRPLKKVKDIDTVHQTGLE
ncbi:MAG: hypothetical protein ACP5J5_03055 [Dissulfurimicrobium sp.]|uniref:hypothetical protein n=1 Tax=Dissulfurimicrobium TaxID=1769732 RepID=UPI001EDA92F2|nr:hypothetical protein [Dissulfurimicrobium hydrothermale]UKL13867.1 hypothetical protein LGS26_00940 [Dissulfurimicrobium hydrothermale]